MGWPKGKTRTITNRANGRPKGALNKITIDVRAAIVESFGALGGAKYLKKLGEIEPKAYASLLGRVIPHQHEIKMEMPSDAELAVMTPLDMLKWTMRACMQSAMIDPTKLALLVDAANKAAQYEHPKLAAIEHKGSLSLDDLTPEQLVRLAAALRDPASPSPEIEIIPPEEPQSVH